MTEARLTSAVLVGAIRRLAEREGGFATLLVKGDEVSGTVLVELRDGGAFVALLERMPDLEQGQTWNSLATSVESLDAYVARRRQSDPDLTIVELDVPDATRLIPLLPTGT